jgi:hypothetical protein
MIKAEFSVTATWEKQIAMVNYLILSSTHPQTWEKLFLPAKLIVPYTLYI